ncbi:MAG: hypothetical protein RLN90_04180 [Balneolaceae bacterium]
MKYLLNTFITLTILLLLTVIVQAQPGLPGAPSQAPIDGGLGLLAAAGGAYAYKKLKHRNQETET